METLCSHGDTPGLQGGKGGHPTIVAHATDKSATAAPILDGVAFDWAGFETDLTRGAASAVRTLLASAPGQTPYAVAFSGFYAETAGVIYLPTLALATEESLRGPECRWSPPDWAYQVDDWCGSEWDERLCDMVAGLPRAQWQQAWDRFAQAMLTVAVRLRADVMADGTLSSDALVYLHDEDGELLVRSVTPQELRRHFPEYAAAADAERALSAVPVSQRVAELAATAGLASGRPRQGLGQERAVAMLLDCGAAAVPVGIAALRRRGVAWQGAKLLADLDIRTTEVIDALWAAVPLTGGGHDWAAAALGRLGAGQQVLARRDLPPATRAAAVTAPYSSFRDHGRSHLPLDYALLAAGLGDPAVATIVADHLSPGSGYCTADAADLAGARSGLDHAEPVIRRHAVVVIGELIGPMGPGGLGDTDVLRHRLTDVAERDDDELVRRLAGYAVAQLRR